ncbi:MAG TPA: hypothetical protein VGO50_12555 [Pyrinomonadaceae bacterium]|nr:hypothetical protein [Pyrinomonadaceae bacterium]
MNSEEIEVSLKAEFESYLKDVTEGFKEKLSQLQAKIDEEIDRHKEEFAKVFSEAGEHFDAHGAVKPAFADIVAEHLKLARDEGAQISANAFAEAEKYEKEHAQPVEVAPAMTGSMSGLRDAIRDVSEKGSQVEILKALIGHAAEFAPRGAFFVLKNERFGGWRTFGTSDEADEALKHVSFSVSDPSVINEAVKDNAVKESSFGEYAEDNEFLSLVEFGQPEKMYAVPLVVRGRSVAVLYADSGVENKPVNVDALETLVQVASLRVELLASLKGTTEPAAETAETAAPAEEPAYTAETPQYEEAHSYQEVHEEEPVNPYQAVESEVYAAPIEQPVETFYEETPAPSMEAEEAVEEVEEVPQAEWQPVSDSFEVSEEPAVEVEETASTNGYDFQSDYKEEPAPEFEVAPSYEASPAPSFEGFAPVTEAPSFGKEASFESFKAEPSIDSMMPVETAVTTEVVQPVSTPVRSRLSERNVDLPIEVSDEERRLHNDARRFARLLVSEIKLYNEQKVKEGRENSDIYNRLQEAVDRSREMYDKRVQPAVAGRFDYFHYELVNALAEGDEGKLGNGYPGASV